MEDEINLLDYWRVIVKWKKLIVGLTIMIALGVFIYGLSQPKLYRATATIMVVDTSGGNLASVASLFGRGGGGGDEKIFPILKSAKLANQVAHNLDLNKFSAIIPKNQELSDEERIKGLAGRLRGAINPINSEGLLNVTIDWPTKDAAEIANAYVKQLGRFLSSQSLNINFHVIDPAVAPASRIKANTGLNMIVAGIFGLFTGVFISFFLEYLQNLPKT